MDNINPQKHYNISQVHKLQVFPWVNCYRSYRDNIFKDMKGENILKAKLVKGSQLKGKRGHTRYYIKGEDLINYIKSKGF